VIKYKQYQNVQLNNSDVATIHVTVIVFHLFQIIWSHFYYRLSNWLFFCLANPYIVIHMYFYSKY